MEDVRIQWQYVQYKYYILTAMNQSTTLAKCSKILSKFQQLKPKQYYQPKTKINRLSSKSKSHNQSCNLSWRNSKSKSKINLNTSSMSKNSSNSKSYTSINKSISKYQTPYSKDSRFDKIMKLQVKPTYKPKKSRRQSIANASFSSMSSLGSTKENKQSNQSRLAKIMNLKVKKPEVSSTLKNYQPQAKNKLEVKSRNIEDNQILLMKECKQKIKKMEKQNMKEDRLWRMFERQRDLRMKQKQRNDRKRYTQERSNQKRFESLVSKELKSIQIKSELKERKNGGFSQYLFPNY